MADKKPLLSIRGATSGTTYRATPDGFVPRNAIRNWQVEDPDTERPRGGRRRCLVRLIPSQLRNAPVQALLAATRAAAQTGLVLGTCESMGAAFSTPSTPLFGQIAALDAVPSMDWFKYLDVTNISGAPADNAVQCCAWDPDGEFLAVSSNYRVGLDWRYSIARLNPATGAVVWRTDVSDSGYDRSVNAIAVTKLYTFVAITSNNPAAGTPKLVGYRNDTGAAAIVGNLEGWARDAVALAVYTDAAGQEYLYVAFNGIASAGTYVPGAGSGTIKAGRWAMQYRAGIMKFSVEGASYGGGGTAKVTFGPQLASTDPYFETTGGRTTPHGYWRLSEQDYPTLGHPLGHGGEITGLACGSDGSVYFTKRNQGWGPNDATASFRPDGSTEGYRTVGKINTDGTLAWLEDTDSIREVDDLGYYNDLDYPGKSVHEPSIGAVCVDSDGDVYVGGRRNATGLSVFALRGDSGVRKWSANLMGAADTVREGAACIDADDNPVFAGDRNTSWDGALGDDANLWKLDRSNGQVLMHFDLNEAVSGLGVAAAGDGRLFATYDKVT